jgi:hypothetical protein
MKKTAKKLTLAKETLRKLSHVELGKVAGGTFVTWTCWSDPEYSCQDEFATGAQATCAG